VASGNRCCLEPRPGGNRIQSVDRLIQERAAATIVITDVAANDRNVEEYYP
jgi:hypothetical protein